MVGFVHNHPDRPFVMGGMFHGQVGLGGGADNRVNLFEPEADTVLFSQKMKASLSPTNLETKFI